MNSDRSPDSWVVCPHCSANFGWNRSDGLVGQVCSCGHMFCYSDTIVEGIRPSDDEDENLDNDGGCDYFNKNVTQDIKDLADEMVTCIESCCLDDEEMTHYIANIIASICPNYKRK